MAWASRQSSYLWGSAGATLQVIAGWWDVYSHLLFGSVDPWWNPAHLALYFGVGLVILAVWRGLRFASAPPAVAIPIRFLNVSGLKLAGLGCIMQVIAGVWNEMVHHIFLREPKIAPAHALLTIGMLTVNLGMIVGLAIEYGMVRHEIVVVSAWKRYAILACIILVFASIWLAAAGALIYVARVFRGNSFAWIVAVLLSIVGTFVLVPAKRVLPGFGSATVIGLVLNSVAYFFLVAYAQVPAYVPWGLLPPALFDILVVALKEMKFTRVLVLSSTVLGLLFYATYFPFTSYLFPWSLSVHLPTAMVFIGSFLGALIGNRLYVGLSSLVLGNYGEAYGTHS